MLEAVGCSGNEDVDVDVWSKKAGEDKKQKNRRDDKSARNIRESAGKEVWSRDENIRGLCGKK